MPLSYHFDVAKQIVTLSGTPAHAGEPRTILQDVLRDPRMRPGYSYLADLRGAGVGADAAGRELVAALRQLWPQLRGARAAMVTTRDVDATPLIADAEHLPMHAFTSYDSAVNWLRAGEDPDDYDEE